MMLSPEQVDYDCSQLIRRVIAKFVREKRKRWNFDKSELLTTGCSPLVLAKAKEDDLKAGSFSALVALLVFFTQAFVDQPHRWVFILSVPVAAWFWLYRRTQYLKLRFSHADNLLVREELMAILSNEKERAFLWRLDAFLSRKPVSS